MVKVLFLAHRYPFPPNKGDKIRAFHIAEHLRKSHEVSLGFVMTPGDSEPDMEWAQKNFASSYCGRVSALDRLFRAGTGFLTGTPLSVATFRHAGLKRWVTQHIAEQCPAFIYVFSSAMAQYVPRVLPAGTKVILDFVDVDSEKWRQYAQTQSLARRWFFGTEAQRLLKFDRGEAARAQASIFVSADERRIFDRLSPETASRHVDIANGVDVEFFNPASVPANETAGKRIVFVGMMDYWPNIDAVTWFAKDILPLIRAKHEDARFQIVGAKPVAAVSALSSLEGVEVTGAVPDVRPYVANAAVVVAPLRIARGIQNKVLEGMAMARPLVTTPGALEGINAMNGRDLLVGETPGELAEAVMSVLDGRALAGLGAAARAFVVNNFEWKAHLRKLDDLMR
ncbi:MAG: TIGR03087 family PEP-CTERM/XrtA system glycosyltransferase [Alphaproteobacteria bacterium]|nr:TIGR03087 family PEP-CTERM/XrtA system glycosyltransferase [Alphaproteobacteria bacterium]